MNLLHPILIRQLQEVAVAFGLDTSDFGSSTVFHRYHHPETPLDMSEVLDKQGAWDDEELELPVEFQIQMLGLLPYFHSYASCLTTMMSPMNLSFSFCAFPSSLVCYSSWTVCLLNLFHLNRLHLNLC